MAMTILGNDHDNGTRYEMVLFMEAVSAYCWTEEVRSLHHKAMALMTQSLSDYFLRYTGIDLNVAITSDYRCTKKSDTFSYYVEEYHTTLFHTQPPQN